MNTTACRNPLPSLTDEELLERLEGIPTSALSGAEIESRERLIADNIYTMDDRWRAREIINQHGAW